MDSNKANRIKNQKPFKPSQALRSALKMRGRGVGTITYFYSAKNERDIVVPSDLQCALALSLEADESIKSWDSDPERIIALVEGEGHIGSKPDAIANHWSGRVGYIEAKYLNDQGKEHSVFQAETQRRAAELVGAEWSCFSEDDVRAQERLLHDWLQIAPVLSHTRYAVKARWEWLVNFVSKAARKGTTLGELRRRSEDPWELVFSASFRLVQLGFLRTDLVKQPLSPATVLEYRERRGE